MNRVRFVAIVAAWFACASSASGADGPRCSFNGSWLGYAPHTAGELVWMSEVSGASLASGTLVMEDPSQSPSLNGQFEDAVRMTSLHGVWERIDGRTYAYTLISMGVDADGNSVWINKKSGYATLSTDCREMTVVGVQQVYLPAQDPYTGLPVHTYGLPDRTAKRMTVYSPYPAP